MGVIESGPFVSLGLKGANMLIDKHFDKVPEKYLHTDAYIPGKHKKKRRDSRDQGQHRDRRDRDRGVGRDQSPSEDEDPDFDDPRVREKFRDRERGYQHNIYEPESDTEETLQRRDAARGRMDGPMPKDGSLPGGAYSQESPYITPSQYSREPPLARPQYMPQQPSAPPVGVEGGYYPPPPPVDGGSRYGGGDRRGSLYEGGRSRRDRRRESWDDNEDYYSESYRRPQRPGMRRNRSSSYHGPRNGRNSDDGNYGALATRDRRRASGSDHLDRAREAAHRYGVKDEIENTFSKSKAGLAGGAVGAVVAGWAANKAQVGYSKKGGKKKPNDLVTLLGAAVGGYVKAHPYIVEALGAADSGDLSAKSGATDRHRKVKLAVNAIVDKYEDGKKGAEEKERRGSDRYRDKDGDWKSEAGKSQRSQSQRGHRSRRDERDRDRDGGQSDTGRSHRSRRRRDSAYASDYD